MPRVAEEAVGKGAEEEGKIRTKELTAGKNGEEKENEKEEKIPVSEYQMGRLSPPY